LTCWKLNSKTRMAYDMEILSDIVFFFLENLSSSAKIVHFRTDRAESFPYFTIIALHFEGLMFSKRRKHYEHNFWTAGTFGTTLFNHQRLLSWSLTIFSKLVVYPTDSPGDHNVEAWALEQIISFLCGRFITVTTRVLSETDF